MRRFVVALCTVFAVAATGLVGYALAGLNTTRAVAETDVNVHMGEFYFNFDKLEAPAGIVHFHVTNDGDVGHDLSFTAFGKTPIIEKGQSAVLTVNFTRAGSYGYLCTVGEHAVYGMQGNFTITGSTGGGGGGTTATTGPTTTAPLATKATVSVSLKEFKILLTQRKRVRVKVKTKKGTKFVFQMRNVAIKSVPSGGKVRFLVKNIGKLPHNFVVTGVGGSKVLSKGQSQTVTLEVPDKGTYAYECTITGHAEAGMKGKLRVV
jgi:plastocyanin